MPYVNDNIGEPLHITRFARNLSARPRIRFSHVAPGIELVIPGLSCRRALLKEENHGLHSGSLKRSARAVEHRMKIAALQKNFPQTHRSLGKSHDRYSRNFEDRCEHELQKVGTPCRHVIVEGAEVEVLLVNDQFEVDYALCVQCGCMESTEGLPLHGLCRDCGQSLNVPTSMPTPGRWRIDPIRPSVN
jgi:hypothetical protein